MYNLRNSPIASLINTIQPCIMDIGTRGGVDEELIAIAWACSVYGFEPETAEIERLRQQVDARWNNVKLLPYAVGGKSGRNTLYIPESEAGASLFKHNPDMIERFGLEHLHVVRNELTVDTVTLDALHKSDEISIVDYMKIDIEGAELDVLKAGSSVLKECMVLKIECSFLPQRLSQPLIWEVAPFMIDNGFEVVEIHDVHRWRRRPLPAHPYKINYQMPYSRGQVAQCDLFFLRRPETVLELNRLVMLIILSSALGYFDYAISTLRAVPAIKELILDEYGFDLETELVLWSALAGRATIRKAIYIQLRTLIPQLRSLAGMLPYPKPVRPY